MINNPLTQEQQEKLKKQISYEEWIERMDQIKISKQDLNKLIMNFFLIEGYKDAAENFKKESGTEISNCDLNFMQERIEVRSLIHSGQIDNAITKVNDIDTKILENNQELFLNLQLQKLIEYIKQNDIEKAIDFAQKQLLPIIEKNPEFMESLEKVMSLLAFDDIQKCPLADLAENSQRIKISSELNYELLKNKSSEKDSKLPTLLKMLMWSQNRLQEKLKFPQIINISTGEFSQKPIIQSTENKSLPKDHVLVKQKSF